MPTATFFAQAPTSEVIKSAKNGLWTAAPGFGVYVHIPFCIHRCHYCDFNTYEGQDRLHGPYVDALVRHIETYAPGHDLPEATSVFFGGGTPTILESQEIGRVLDAIRARVGLVPGAEVTVEANPETVDEAYFGSLLDVGVTRVSIGIQSLVDTVLAGLGRTHSSRVALDTVAAARRAGVDDLNVDLIYGSPWERETDWTTTLAGAIESGPDHISAYALTVESGTPLHTLVATRRVPDVDPDVQAERYGIAAGVLADAGYERYEISNWARPGRASAHNVLYWCAGEYLGFGAGAHGHLDGRRYWAVRLPREWIARADAGAEVEAGSECLDDDAYAGEALMLGLRLVSGVEPSAFVERFGVDAWARRQDIVADLEGLGLLEASSERIRLTERGTFVANEVGARLL